ncbi:MAG: hypothetical protein VX478_02740 [Chloroflexota bacterium]|nr:hypothetical protein [Chloroflexota bacterium]
MKIKYGRFTDEYLAPLWMLGLVRDVNHDGSWHISLVFGAWYIGVAFNKRSDHVI